jgi:hypothetical protein
VAQEVAGSIRALIEGIFSGDASLSTGPFAAKWRDDLFVACRGLLLTMPTQLAGTVFAPARAAHMPHLWASLAAMASVGKIVSAAAASPSTASSTEGAGAEESKGEDAAKSAAAAPAAGTTEAGTAAVAGMLEPVKSAEDAAKDAAAMLHRRRLCENHDDGVTEGAWACLGCVDLRAEDTPTPPLPTPAAGKELTEDEIAGSTGLALCDTCDHTVHLPRGRRTHKRVPIKNRVDEALKVEYLGGMSRVKLAWLQVSVYEDHCKAMVEFKREATRGAAGPQCRFCDADITADNRSPRDPPSPALEHVCSAEDCQEKMDLCCTKTLDCGHLCGGVRGEEKCLPCYQGCDGVALEKDAYCSVCYTEPLGQAPTVRLTCGHAFHYGCVKRILDGRWNGARMNFGFMGCPLCKVRGGRKGAIGGGWQSRLVTKVLCKRGSCVCARARACLCVFEGVAALPVNPFHALVVVVVLFADGDFPPYPEAHPGPTAGAAYRAAGQGPHAPEVREQGQGTRAVQPRLQVVQRPRGLRGGPVCLLRVLQVQEAVLRWGARVWRGGRRLRPHGAGVRRVLPLVRGH